MSDVTPMAAPRRQLLLEAAADLFAARGYHAVGVDDIGAAAGISGPGVYRHFAGKQALLEALCDAAMERLLSGARAVSAGAGEPATALAGLVDLHAGFAVGERALLSVWVREQRALSEDVRRSLRSRQRAYEQLWRAVVGSLRQDLVAAEVSVAVTAALALLNSTALTDAGVDAPRLRGLLRRMALAALLPSTPAPAAPPTAAELHPTAAELRG